MTKRNAYWTQEQLKRIDEHERRLSAHGRCRDPRARAEILVEQEDDRNASRNAEQE